MIDLHIHTSFSSDSKEDMENYIIKAIETGQYNTIGFTEHFDFDYAYSGIRSDFVDFVGFFKKIAEMKEKYKGQIKILVGAEFGYADNENAMALTNMIWDKYPLDYAINSVHLVDNEDVWYADYFKNRTKEEAYGKYLKWIRKSLDTKTKFHILAHLGYCQRKAIYQDKLLNYCDFPELFDDIFKTMIERDIILEINTSTRGICDLIPSVEALIRYKELGGKLITFSSDAHQVERIFDRYEYVCNVAKELGFEGFAYVENGELKQYEL
ncbi:MAG: histidinol-phosphatase HisJ family protein [Bacillota bacterium]